MNSTIADTAWENDENLTKRLGKASSGLQFIADYQRGVGYTKQAIERAAQRVTVPGPNGKPTKLSYWRAFDLWYRKARRVEDYELDAIAVAVETKRREAERNEIHDLKLRLARLEARLRQTDEDFHREDVAALGLAISGAGQRGGGRR